MITVTLRGQLAKHSRILISVGAAVILATYVAKDHLREPLRAALAAELEAKTVADIEMNSALAVPTLASPPVREIGIGMTRSDLRSYIPFLQTELQSLEMKFNAISAFAFNSKLRADYSTITTVYGPSVQNLLRQYQILADQLNTEEVLSPAKAHNTASADVPKQLLLIGSLISSLKSALGGAWNEEVSHYSELREAQERRLRYINWFTDALIFVGWLITFISSWYGRERLGADI